MPKQEEGALDAAKQAVAALPSLTPDQAEALALALVLPNVSVRIDRKINIGNYESLGIGTTIYMPVGLSPEQAKAFGALQSEAVARAYETAAKEIAERVSRIRENLAAR